LKKASTEENVIEKTIPRETIWQAQTPQTFRRAALEKALAAAEQDGITGTDEAFLLEQLNYKITIILGSARNIKITTPDDWTIAEALLKGVNND
jgi:2-C-methyl-D-erythritol 4-phosphate cytidylyltransferase